MSAAFENVALRSRSIRSRGIDGLKWCVAQNSLWKMQFEIPTVSHWINTLQSICTILSYMDM